MNVNYFYDIATDLANCILVDQTRKREARATILELMVQAIQVSKTNPDLIKELESAAKYS